MVNGERKVRAAVLVRSATYTWKSYMSCFSVFFSSIFAGPRFVEIKKFCYHGSMTLRLFFSISSIVHLNGIWLLIWRFLSKTIWREVGRHVTMVAKFLDLNKLCWQRRQLALSNGKRNVWATVLFLGAIMHRKVIRVRRDFPWILCLPRISYLAFKYEVVLGLLAVIYIEFA